MSVLGPAPAAGAPPFWWAPGALVTRLLALALLALLLAGVGAAWIVSQAQQQQVLQRLAAQQEDEVQLLARLLASKVEQNQRVLVAVASGLTPALLRQPAALQAQVRQALASARWWDSLLLARADGVLLLHLRHGRTQEATALEPAERDGLRRTLAEGKPLLSEPIIGPGTEARLLLTVPLHGEDGSLLGVLGATLRLHSPALLPPTLVLSTRADAPLVLLTREGTVLAHSQPERVLARVEHEPGLRAWYREWLQRGQPLVEGAHTVYREGQIVSVAALPLPQWLVARTSAQPLPVTLTDHGTLADVGWRVATWLLLLALACLLAMAWVAQPLAWLRHRAPLLLQAADLAQLPPWPQARGEVNALAGVLRTLAQQRQQLRAQSERQALQLHALFEHAPLGIAITRAGLFEQVNRCACQLLGYTPATLQGQHTRLLHASVADYERLQQQVRAAFVAHGSFSGDVCFVRQDGSRVWARVQGYALGQAAEEAGTLWILEDGTAERAALHEQDWAQQHDPLTLLPHRDTLAQRLEALMAQRASMPGAPAAGVLLFLDLDHFAVLNTEAGHAAGNDVLRHVARLLQQQVRQLGWVARVGGDAFAVVLPDCSLARGRAVAEQLRVAVQGCTFAHRGQSFSLQASLGLVQLAPAWASVSALLHAADMACYAAKRAGRNQVCEATPEDAPK